MASYDTDLIENPSTRCPCMLVLDVSASMSGAPIEELNAGVSRFIQAVQEDEVASYSVEVGVILAGGGVSEALPLTAAADIDLVPNLHASGATPLGAAVALAIKRLEERKETYRGAGVPYYQPWLVIISDGAPTDDDWERAAAQAYKLSAARKLVSLPVAVQGADMDILGRFSHKPARRLQGIKFGEFFEWLSQSMSRVSGSNSSASEVALPPSDPWASI